MAIKHKTNCTVCGTEFEARKGALYCSDNCRWTAAKKRDRAALTSYRKGDAAAVAANPQLDKLTNLLVQALALVGRMKYGEPADSDVFDDLEDLTEEFEAALPRRPFDHLTRAEKLELMGKDTKEGMAFRSYMAGCEEQARAMAPELFN